MARKAALPIGLYVRGKTYWMDFTDPSGARRRGSLGTGDLATAKAILEKEKKRLVAQAHGLAPKETDVAVFKNLYLEAARVRMAPHVWAQRKRRLDSFFTFCGVHRLDAIRPEHISGFATWRLENATRRAGKNADGSPIETAIKRSTVLDDLKSIRAALRWAVRHDYLERSPFDRADPLKPDDIDKRIVYLSIDERDRLLDACGDPVALHGRGGKGTGKTRARRTPVYIMASVACYAGLRLSEILWLNWEDVDFDRSELLVRNKEGWRTKTRAARGVPLVPALVAIMKPIRLPAGPCFTTKSGKRYTRRNVLRELRRAAERAKIAKEVNFNALRHTYATTLVSAGVQLFAVSRWLGHKSMRVTEAHYAAFAPNEALVNQAAAALAAPKVVRAS